MKKLIIATLLGPGLCFAQEGHQTISMQGWFAGGAIGQSKVKGFCDGVPRSSGLTLVSCDDKDDYYKAYLGYDLLPFLALDVAYNHLGQVKVQASNSGQSGVVAAEGDALTLRASLEGRVESLFATGSLGISRWDVTSSLKLGNLTYASVHDSGYSFYWALGAGVDINKHLAIRLEYERFNSVGSDSTTGKADVTAISLGLQYRF